MTRLVQYLLITLTGYQVFVVRLTFIRRFLIKSLVIGTRKQLRSCSTSNCLDVSETFSVIILAADSLLILYFRLHLKQN